MVKEAFAGPVQSRPASRAAIRTASAKPWSRMEQALRAADLLLQAGGFSAIVLDMAGIAPECAMRVPMATWFRYRAAAERTQASLLLLTQSPCAKSSAELLLRFSAGNARSDEATVFTGIEHRVELERRRFAEEHTHVVAMRKPPQRETGASWRSQAMGRCAMKPGELYACVCAREFPAQALLRLRPELRNRACVVMEGEPPLEQVCAMTERGAQAGRGLRHDQSRSGDVSASCRAGPLGP